MTERNEPRGSANPRIPPPEVGQIVEGRYALRRSLGPRGAGQVFEAEQLFTGRRVTLRIGPEERLLALARRLSSARHPGIVDVLDAGPAPPGRAYLATELVEGRTLEGLLTTRARLAKDDALGVALQLADALVVAHARDVLHGRIGLRDVFVVREGDVGERIKLVGFLAAATDSIEEDGGLGLLVEDADPRVDVRGIARVLVECLLGPRAEPLDPLRRDERERLVQSFGPDVERVASEALAASGPYATVEALRAALGPLAKAGRGTRILQVPPIPQQARATPAGAGRRFRRGSYTTPVRLVLASGASLDGRSEDVSEGGLLVIAARDCPTDTRLEVRFALPIDGRIMTLTATVKWARAARPDQPDGPRAIGVEFDALPDPARQAIARYVDLVGDPRG